MVSLPRHFGHVIVGGGITGASIAYHLAKGILVAPESQGIDKSICVLDRAGVGSGQTSRSVGIVLHQHKKIIGVELAKQTSKDVFHDLSVHTDSLIMERPGSLNALTGVIEEKDFFVDPHSLVASYFRRAKDLMKRTPEVSFIVQENTEVDGMSIAENFVQLQIGSDVISADNVYVATGVWSDRFLQPIHWANIRSHYWEFAVASDFLASKYPDPRTNIPIYLGPGIYIKLTRNRRKVEIGIQEKESVVFAKVPKHNDDSLATDANDDPFGPTELLLEKHSIIDDYLGVNFLEAAEMRDYISGLSTYTADGLPVIDIARGKQTGKTASIPSIISCGGCNGYGITWAGGLGKAVANFGLYKKNNQPLLESLHGRRFEKYSPQDLVDLAVAQRHNKFAKSN